MDDVVRRAMARWPNVPAVFGWMRLDRRGNWLVRLAEGEPARFDRVMNEALIAFIQRNYAADDTGRYFFQNGPQRVYLDLDYTPWVMRLNDTGDGFFVHTGLRVEAWRSAFIDEAGNLVLATDFGAAVVLDRDLPSVANLFVDARGGTIDVEAFFDRICAGGDEHVMLLGRRIRVASIRSDRLPAYFGFVRVPTP